MSIKKRFIAGAVCPRCGEMDRIVSYTQNDQQHRECVSCDFHEALSSEQANPVEMKEIETRVTPSDVTVDADAQPLFFRNNPAKSSK